jgi:hypothetical protein
MTTTTDAPPTLSLDLAATERFVETIAGSSEASCTWQLLKPGAASPLFHGTLAEYRERLLQANRSGYNIYFTVNETDLKGRKTENIKRVRAFFVDDDKNQVTDEMVACLPPSMKVLTKRGPHFYWLVSDAKLDDFTAVQTQLAQHFGTDAAIKDLPRVMRVPGLIRHPKKDEGQSVVKLVYAHPERRYRVEEVVKAFPAAEVLEAQHIQGSEHAGVSKGQEDVRRPAASWIVKLAESYVANVPGAVEGKSGDNTTFALAAKLTRYFGLSQRQALTILKTWNASCLPPWSEAELIQKIGNGWRYGTEEVDGVLGRCRTEELSYLPVQGVYYMRGERNWNLEEPIRCIHAAVACLVGKGRSAEEARAIINNHRVVIAAGVDCQPNGAPLLVMPAGPVLNTWVPPEIERRPGEWPRISRIIDVVTDGDSKARAWLINWMAAKAQKPGERTQTAVVLIGEQGTGKSTLADVMREIVGRKNSQTISQSDLDGNFNGHYAGRLFIVGEEVATSENRRCVSGRLKQAITDSTVTVTVKFVPEYAVKNRAAYWFNTNATRPLEVDKGDRRYSVIFSRAKGVKDDRELFSLLRSCHSGNDFSSVFQAEIAAFLDHLLSFGVDDSQVGTPLESPYKDGLIDVSMSSAEEFIEDILDRGLAAVVGVCCEGRSWKVADGVRCDEVYRAYSAWAPLNGHNHPVSAPSFRAELNRRGFTKRRETSGLQRSYYYTLPPNRETGSSANGTDTAPNVPPISDGPPKNEEEKNREWEAWLTASAMPASREVA